MGKTYQISDLFFTSWNELKGKTIAQVYPLYLQLQNTPLDDPKYGYLLIEILRLLRKNVRLVDKIDEDQAVDIFNDLKFLNEPWYFFPYFGSSNPELSQPQDKLARHTFDHFIYADNEYSSYVVTQDFKYLRRLVATLYQKKFDKEAVEEIASALQLKEWELHLVFFTYYHVREFVMKRCKTLLPSAPKSTEEDNDKARPTGAMWLKIKHRLAETPAFQGYDLAGSSNMYSTLDYLEDLAQIKEANARR
jgi:hypothetical protein